MSIQPGKKIPVEYYIDALKSLKGIPYIWGGKDPHGLDCSGTVTYGLKMASETWHMPCPDLTLTHNAARLYQDCGGPDAIPEAPMHYEPGMLAFYGPRGSPNHVMTVWAMGDGVGWMCSYGACGGGHTTTTKEIAAKQGAMVQTRRSIAYRRDFLGVYRFPLIEYITT